MERVLMAAGTVKFYDASKGFGFIAVSGGGKDVFVHATAVQKTGLSSLREGQSVSFDIERDQKGRESAVNLRAG